MLVYYFVFESQTITAFIIAWSYTLPSDIQIKKNEMAHAVEIKMFTK